MILKNQNNILIIKNIKHDIFAPIIIKCKSYSKLLDATLKLTNNGLKLDVLYLENEDDSINDKKFNFIIKRRDESVGNDYTYLKMFEILISDSLEKYYIFYKIECSDEERRDNKLDDLGI